MPLHLLGKKSWNVYNAENIARVRRDEAEAAAREAAEEQRMQEEDAKRRIQLLRGESVDALPPAESTPTARDEHESSSRIKDDRSDRLGRKRRRLQGEDDTERDIRYAREDRELAEQTTKRARTNDAPIVDNKGHIALFTPGKDRSRNAEAEAEEAKRKKEMEDQYTMRFANAAGFKQAAGSKPWYSKGTTTDGLNPPDRVDRDVWGNDDPRRKDREQMRLTASDPLLAIQKGVQGVRRAERAKKEWKEQREREVDGLIREERRAARREGRQDRHRRHRNRSRDKHRSTHRRSPSSENSLKGFRLDDTRSESRECGSRHHSDRRVRERERSKRGHGDAERTVSQRHRS